MKGKRIFLVVAAVLVLLTTIAVLYSVRGDYVLFIITNRSETALQDVQVLFNAEPRGMKDIPSGASGKVYLRIASEGSWGIAYSRDGKRYDVRPENYLCGGMGGAINVAVNADKVSVEENSLGRRTYDIPARPVER